MANISNIEKVLSEGNFTLACELLAKLIDSEEYQLLADKQKIHKKVLDLQNKFNQYSKDEQIDQGTILKSTAEFTKYLLLINNFNNEPRSGFRQYSPQEAIKLATEKIENAQWMKVIGSGRQHFAENSDSNEVLKYYKAIEEKLERDTESKKPFFIQRITQHKLQDKFQEHLKNCFNIVNKNKNFYQVVFYGKLMITNTFYIIKGFNGHSCLFLTLNVETDALLDNVLVFYTDEEEIVRQYQDYFDQFWQKEGKLGRIVESSSDFNKYIPFDDRLYDKYNQIKNFIKRVPNESARMQHLRYEINQIHTRLRGLNDCNLTYTYAEENKDIITWFQTYMESLEEGKAYRTVSLLNFWTEISTNLQVFIRTQEEALLKGARISRVFLVDSSNLNLDEPSQAPEYNLLRKVIKLNYEQSGRHPLYDFNILFSSISDERAGFKNFAIWHDQESDYKVLFKMKYGDPNFRDTTTELIFANYNADEHLNVPHVEGYETMFSQSRSRAKKQIQEILDFSNNADSNGQVSKKDIHNETYLNWLKHMDINVEKLAKNNNDDPPETT